MQKILAIYGDTGAWRALDEMLSPAGYKLVGVPYVQGVVEEVLPLTKPDLVVLDVGGSGETVRDLCGQVRTVSNDIPLLVLGSHPRTEAILLLDLGADDYITKPVEEAEFLARVRARVRWRAGRDR